MTIAGRFDMREERDGTWTVFDIFTRLPIEYDGILMTGMTIDEADDAVDLLAYIDIQTRRGFKIDGTP